VTGNNRGLQLPGGNLQLESNMDSYVSADAERRRQGQVFGTADELRILRTLNARANAMRRLAGFKAGKKPQSLSKSGKNTGTRVA